MKASQNAMLVAVRKQLELLQDSLQQLYESPDLSSWPDMLAKFNVLSYRYRQLLEEVNRLTLQNQIVHPFSLPMVDEDFIPRILLRTKMIPEIEEEDLKIQDGTGKELQAMVENIDPLDDESAFEVEKKLEIQKMMHDDLTRSVQEAFSTRPKADLFNRVTDPAEVDESLTKNAEASLHRLLQAISSTGL